MKPRQLPVRLTEAQHGWLRSRAFDLNLPMQVVVEDALVAIGMPRGDTARTGDVVTGQPLPEGVKDLIDRDGHLWGRSGTGSWQRYTMDGRTDRTVPPTTIGDMLRRFGPMTVSKLRGQ